MDDCYVVNPNCQFPSYWIIKKHIEEVVGQCDTCICNAKSTACNGYILESESILLIIRHSKMNSTSTTSTIVENSEAESAKKESVLIPIKNQCKLFSLLTRCSRGDGLPNLDQNGLSQDVPELEDDDSDEELEPEYS